jgi:hypothetical protein
VGKIYIVWFIKDNSDEKPPLLRETQGFSGNSQKSTDNVFLVGGFSGNSVKK